MTDSNDDWLDQLLEDNELPSLKAKAKAPAKPARTRNRLPGERHEFKEMKNSHTFGQLTPRGPDQLIPQALARYKPEYLSRAIYRPRHWLGISPIWPQHHEL